MSDLEIFPLSLPGGINQSAPQPGERDLENLDNFSIFRGRIALRAPLEVLATITGADAVLAVLEHVGKLWAIIWEDTLDQVHLYSMNVDGTVLVNEATVWTAVTSAPIISAVSFTGGTASENKSRIYISDYDQNQNTVYWDDAASSISILTEDIDNDSSPENLKFSLLIAYKFHLWGTGFYEGTPARPEMLRFTQPGAIPGTDPAGGTNPKVFFSSDHRSLGRRGQKITAVTVAGDRLIVFQSRAANAIYGSGGDTWTKQELSNITGCAGPRGVVSVDKRLAYFWAFDGPYRTDGIRLEYIGDPIRQMVTEVDAAEDDIVVGYSPDDGLVYYMVSPGGADSYHKALVFDDRRQRWLTTTWLTGSAVNIQIGAFGIASAGAGDSPSGAPSSLAATTLDDVQIDLVWTNADTNINTTTKVYRDTSASFTPNDSTNKIATVDSGVATYEDPGRTSATQYYYQLIHERNNINSAASNEDSDTTLCKKPSITSTVGITNGNRIAGNTNETGADVLIQQKIADGSFATIVTLVNPGSTYSHDETGLTCGIEHTYRVKCQLAGKPDSVFSAEVTQVSCNTNSAPTAPTVLVATGVSPSQIDLVWVDNSDDEDGFSVYRSFDGVEYNPLVGGGGLPAGTTIYSDTGLPAATTFFYQIQAFNSFGISLSNTDDGTTDP